MGGNNDNPFEVYDDVLPLLKKYVPVTTSLHFHCFTGPKRFVKQLIKDGYTKVAYGVTRMLVSQRLQEETHDGRGIIMSRDAGIRRPTSRRKTPQLSP